MHRERGKKVEGRKEGMERERERAFEIVLLILFFTKH
jgi:hypothetical protein